MAIDLVADIANSPNSSNATEVIEIPGPAGGMAISADTHEGWELITIDASGNKTIHTLPESNLLPKELTHFRDSQGQDWVYFSGQLHYSDTELYRLKWGTNQVTQVKDINAFGSSDPKDLTVVGNSIYFTAWTSLNGRELWKTDGTASGTVMVKDIRTGLNASSNPTELVKFDTLLFFTADDGVTGRELWISGGTSNTTFRVHDIHPGANSSNPRELTVAGDKVYFSAFNPGSGREVWKSDGINTTLLKNLQTAQFSSNPEQLTAWNNKLMFTADVSGSGRELYWYEPTVFNDTLMIKDIFPGAEGSHPLELTVMNDQLYFSASAPNSGRELWKSNGFTAGTQMVKDIIAGPGASSPHNLLAVGDRLYFAATDPVKGTEPFKSDGTSASTFMVRDIALGGSNSLPKFLAAVNGRAVFVADQAVSGRELYTSSGTATSTNLIDLFPGTQHSFPFGMTRLGNDVYFFANDQQSAGVKLFQAVGGMNGAVTEIATSDADFALNTASMKVVGNKLYVLKRRITGNAGFQLIKYDPATGVSTSVKEIAGTFDFSLPEMHLSGNVLYMILRGNDNTVQLWKSDGSSAGTSRLRSDTTFTSITSVTDGNGRFYFRGLVGTVHHLWRSLGTNGTTTPIPNLASPLNLIVKGDHVYFSAFDGTSINFYRINGTNAPVIIRSHFMVEQGILLNDTMYFSATDMLDSNGSSQLWTSTGTPASTTLLKVIDSTVSSRPEDFRIAGGKVYFTAHSAALGRELYVTDGTTNGTKLLKNIGPNSTDATIHILATFNNELYFKAFDGVKHSIWKSNGTTAGTVKVAAINNRFLNINDWYSNVLVVGTRMYISARDELFGHELFTYQV